MSYEASINWLQCFWRLVHLHHHASLYTSSSQSCLPHPIEPGDAPANVAVDCGQYDGNEDSDIDVHEADDNAPIDVEKPGFLREGESSSHSSWSLE